MTEPPFLAFMHKMALASLLGDAFVIDSGFIYIVELVVCTKP